MHEPDFQALTAQLQAAGIASRHTERSVAELKDHFADLVAELRNSGMNDAAASAEANRQLGELSMIGEQFARRTELRAWPYRFPVLARWVLPAACLAVLPMTPVIAGWQHASIVMRCAFGVHASAKFTAVLLGILQLSLQLS
ncbi:MAG: hypothetical protein RIA65_04760 [Woeseia sp.]